MKALKLKTCSNLQKGSGVALYIHNTLYADIIQPASRVTENLESLFVQLTNADTPITIGVIYRPPSGDQDQALIKLSVILDDLPKHSYFGGDFNIDLLQHKSINIIDFEERFLPLISIVTHENQVARAPVLINL